MVYIGTLPSAHCYLWKARIGKIQQYSVCDIRGREGEKERKREVISSTLLYYYTDSENKSIGSLVLFELFFFHPVSLVHVF